MRIHIARNLHAQMRNEQEWLVASILHKPQFFSYLSMNNVPTRVPDDTKRTESALKLHAH